MSGLKWVPVLVLSAMSLTAPESRAADPPPTLQAHAAAAVALTDGRLRVPGLLHPVRVQRDRWGVPHIYAANQHDLFFAQGFVVAQDRLFQMELWKRSGQGRLAEILGPSAIERDANARRLRYRGDMTAEFASYAPDAKEILQAFTSGINAYIDRAQRPGAHGLPVEFAIAGFEPEHWRPEDCLNRLAAYSMTGNAASELQHAALVALLGAPAASALLELDPTVRLDPAPAVDFSGLSASLLADVVSSDRRVDFPADALQESNDWTISGALTATGKPLLANDPHRVIAEPSLRYVVHLVAPGWDVIGAGEPGLPGVADGHNPDIAWGFTIFGIDQQDLYLETLDPDTQQTYATPDGWAPLTIIPEIIRVRGAAPVTVQLKFTRHGPVLWENGTRALALRWVGSEPGTAGYLGSLALDRAHNWEEFERAMPRWKVPSENIVYADRAGHIGEHSTGLAPIRKNWTGLLPVPGNGAYEWSGFIANRDLPHHYDSPAGFIATANQKTIPDSYPYAVGYEWAPANRYHRIVEVLEDGKANARKFDLEHMQALQSDVVSLPARALQALLRRGAGGDDTAARLVLDWDGALRADSAPAALYELWTVQLRQAYTAKIVPERARRVLGVISLTQVIHGLTQPREDVFGANPVSARDELLRNTLREAWDRLIELQGADSRAWTWGGLHRMTFRHPLDGTPILAALLDRGPVPRSGDGDVVQATSYRDASFDQVSGASYREIFDLANWDRSLGINVPGQSGQPGSKHYDDLLGLWCRGEYFPLSYSKRAVDAVTTDVLELLP